MRKFLLVLWSLCTVVIIMQCQMQYALKLDCQCFNVSFKKDFHSSEWNQGSEFNIELFTVWSEVGDALNVTLQVIDSPWICSEICLIALRLYPVNKNFAVPPTVCFFCIWSYIEKVSAYNLEKVKLAHRHTQYIKWLLKEHIVIMPMICKINRCA